MVRMASCSRWAAFSSEFRLSGTNHRSRAILGTVREKSGRRRKVETTGRATGRAAVDDDEAQRMFAATVGDALRKARLGRTWTQAQLAEAARLSANYVARLERGELGPSFFVANRLADALGIEVAALLDVRDVAPPVARPVRRVAGR
jgi:ribosome-binding protein aMBF1 (putative translation factor)